MGDVKTLSKILAGKAESGAEACVHNRACSLSRPTCHQGSVHDTDSRCIVTRRVGVLRDFSGGTATALCMIKRAKNYGDEVKVALETDSVSGRDCRCGWVVERCHTWDTSCCGCQESSKGGKR